MKIKVKFIQLLQDIENKIEAAKEYSKYSKKKMLQR